MHAFGPSLRIWRRFGAVSVATVCAAGVVAAPQAARVPAAAELWLVPSVAALAHPTPLAQGIKLLPDEPAKALRSSRNPSTTRCWAGTRIVRRARAAAAVAE